MWLLWAVVGGIGSRENTPAWPEDARVDRDVVRRMADNDADALAELYDRHARGIYSFALRIVGEQAEAEDVVQEVFSQAWMQARRYEPSRGAVAAWLLSITRSRAIDRVRSRRARVDSVVAEEPQLKSLVDPAEPQDLVLATREQANLVRDALGRLPVLQRIAIEMAYFEGLTQSEIPARLGEPLGTVKTRVRLALLKLRDALAEPRI